MSEHHNYEHLSRHHGETRRYTRYLLKSVERLLLHLLAQTSMLLEFCLLMYYLLVSSFTLAIFIPSAHCSVSFPNLLFLICCGLKNQITKLRIFMFKISLYFDAWVLECTLGIFTSKIFFNFSGQLRDDTFPTLIKGIQCSPSLGSQIEHWGIWLQVSRWWETFGLSSFHGSTLRRPSP